MVKRKWSNWKERVAPEGSFRRRVANKIEAEGSIDPKKLTAWVRTTNYASPEFTDAQIGVAFGSLLMILENYGAIEEKDGKIVWIGE